VGEASLGAGMSSPPATIAASPAATGAGRGQRTSKRSRKRSSARTNGGPSSRQKRTLPDTCARSNGSDVPLIAMNVARSWLAASVHMCVFITAPNSIPAAPQAAASWIRPSSRPNTRASSAPLIPTSPQPAICHGVHGPWEMKKFDTSAATAPTAKPGAAPSV
jgi:hypothetical protein